MPAPPVPSRSRAMPKPTSATAKDARRRYSKPATTSGKNVATAIPMSATSRISWMTLMGRIEEPDQHAERGEDRAATDQPSGKGHGHRHGHVQRRACRAGCRGRRRICLRSGLRASGVGGRVPGLGRRRGRLVGSRRAGRLRPGRGRRHRRLGGLVDRLATGRAEGGGVVDLRAAVRAVAHGQLRPKRVSVPISTISEARKRMIPPGFSCRRTSTMSAAPAADHLDDQEEDDQADAPGKRDDEPRHLQRSGSRSHEAGDGQDREEDREDRHRCREAEVDRVGQRAVGGIGVPEGDPVPALPERAVVQRVVAVRERQEIAGDQADHADEEDDRTEHRPASLHRCGLGVPHLRRPQAARSPAPCRAGWRHSSGRRRRPRGCASRTEGRPSLPSGVPGRSTVVATPAATSRWPQLRQKARPGGFSVPHRGHCVLSPTAASASGTPCAAAPAAATAATSAAG